MSAESDALTRFQTNEAAGRAKDAATNAAVELSEVAAAAATKPGYAAAAQAAAPAGGTGATAGAYDTANNRDALIALVNAMRTVLVDNGLMKGSA